MEIKYGRRRSGIKRELNDKINDWLNSITDKSVREAAAKDVIVTGGSIASMLLGEKINDFDVYFRTKETTLQVADYYVKVFLQNNAETLSTGNVEYTPEVREENKKNLKGQDEDRVIIYMKSAGVAAETQKAYKYFEQLNAAEAENFSESLDDRKEDGAKYRPVFLSQNAITLSDKMQIVIRFYGEPEKIHDNYDFLHAMCYWDHDKKELVCPAEALEALLSRTLTYRGSLYPIASIFRMKKFLERGWRISAGQQLKIMWQISEIDLKDFDVLQEQLTGVDMAYLHQLIEALH